jgi:hypothetical protein
MTVSKFSFWLTEGGFNRTCVVRKEAHNWVEWDIGIGRGNPQVIFHYPYPYPPKPIPSLEGTGFGG